MHPCGQEIDVPCRRGATELKLGKYWAAMRQLRRFELVCASSLAAKRLIGRGSAGRLKGFLEGIGGGPAALGHLDRTFCGKYFCVVGEGARDRH